MRLREFLSCHCFFDLFDVVISKGTVVFAFLLSLCNLTFAGDVKWPPKVGEPYPDLKLTDQTGKEIRLSSLKGKVIPGFQLVDRDFILRSDATGHRPANDLWKHLLPMVPQLLT